MWSTCNLPCNYLSSLLSECQRLLREMKEVETYLFQLGCPKADKWLTEEKFLKVISSYTQDLKNARSSVTEKILEHIYYTCHFNWKGILTQAFYLFSQLRENFERVRWILALYHPSTPSKTGTLKSRYKASKDLLFFCCCFARGAAVCYISKEGSII